MPFIKTTENIDFILSLIATGAYTRSYLMFRVDVRSSKYYVFSLLMPIIEFVEDGRFVGFVHKLQKEGFHEVVFSRPKQQQIVLSLKIVPFSQNKQFCIFLQHSISLKSYRNCQTFLLFKSFLLGSYQTTTNIHFCIVAQKRALRSSVCEIVHDKHWYFIGFAMNLIYFIENFGRFVYFEVDFG